MYRKILVFSMISMLMLLSDSFSVVSAVPTFHGGPPPPVSTYGIPGNVSIWMSAGPRMGEEEVRNLHQLADEGVKINYNLLWWGEPGIEGTPLDMFYNETFREQICQVIDYNIDGSPPDFYHGLHEWKGIDPEKLWAVTLSAEEPFSSYSWTHLAKYSDFYYEETGFQLKSEMNETEWHVYREWLNEKTVGVFNYLYDYVKSKWPHFKVFQFVGMAAAAWLGYDLAAPYELKADGFMMDWYGYEPWRLYDLIRRYKTTLPDKEFHITLWGTQSWPWEGELGGFEPIRRHAWIAYLAGADAIGWFTWHPTEGWGPFRKDPLGQRLFVYVNRLNRELMKLPVMKPKPQVLGVGGEFIGFFTDPSFFQGFGGFIEYDAVNQRFFAKSDMDLSKYRLIMVAEHTYFDEAVRKLNDYVEDGGNVIFLAGTGWNDKNIYGNDTRDRFLIEENAVQSVVAGHVRINISRPNILDLEMDYDGRFHETFVLQIKDLNENCHPIGDFYLIEEDGATSEIADYPLILYHNRSNPNSGWILYWGAAKSSRTPGVTWQNYGDYQLFENYRDMKFLYKEVFRAFADFLNISSSVSTRETENVLVTQSKLIDESILAGLLNFNFDNRSIMYSLDLEYFGFPDGEYWVHSLDENTTVGRFQSHASKLEIPMVLPGKYATKLFLISQEKPEPSYSVEVSPEIPSVEDVDIYEEPTLFPPLWSYGTAEKEPYSQVWSISVSSDGDYIATGSIDNKVRLFDRSGNLIWSRETGDRVYSVSISSDGNFVAAGSRDHKVYFFNGTGNLLWSYETRLAVRSISISSDGGYIAAGSEDGRVYLFDRSGSLLWSYKTRETLESVSISSDGRCVAAGSEDFKVYFFDRPGTLLWSYETGGPVPTVSISSDGSYVAAGSHDSRVYFFDRTGNLLWDYETRWIVGDVSISSDGEYIAVGSLDAYVYFFNRSGRLLWEYETGLAVFSVSVSSDGSYVAAGSCDFNVYLFNRSGSRLWGYKTGADVMSVSVSHDGDYIATGSDDHKVYFFSSTLHPLQATAVLSSQTATRGETVTVSAIVKDDAETLIEGATVTAAIEDLEVLIILSDQGNGNYRGAIDTSDINEGTYSLVVTAQKEGYKSAQTPVNLTIKTPVSWMVYVGIATAIVVMVALMIYLIRRRS